MGNILLAPFSLSPPPHWSKFIESLIYSTTLTSSAHTHANTHIITCNLRHTWMKALFIESLLLLSSKQSIVLALLSQLPPTHVLQLGYDDYDSLSKIKECKLVPPGGYSLPLYMGWGPCQYLGSEILQHNHIWGL